MLSNRVKRNIWLALAIMSGVATVGRAIQTFNGSVEWWNVLMTLIITAFCVKYYLCYRKKVKQGILFDGADAIK